MQRRPGNAWLATALVFACSTALFLLTRQAALVNDGIFFVGRLENGELLQLHFLSIPVMAALHALLEAVAAVEPETSLKTGAALFGGIGAAIFFRVGLRVFGDRATALAAAATLAFVPAWWFHATASEIHSIHGAAATLLLLGLIGTLHGPAASPATNACLLLGAALTPATHASGVCILLPIAVLAIVHRTGRRRVLTWAGIGYACYAAAHVWLYLNKERYTSHVDSLGGNHRMMLTDWTVLETCAYNLACELPLAAAPASTLAVLGFVVMRRSAPATAWLSLAWIAAWTAMCCATPDRLVGSYYVPTMPAIALLSVVAVRHVGGGLPRVGAALVVAALPALLFELSEPAGLVAWPICAGALLAAFRGGPGGAAGGGERPRHAAPLLAATCALCSAITLAPDLFRDPHRDRIRAMAAAAGAPSVVFVIESVLVDWLQWQRYYPLHAPPDSTLLNPAFTVALPEDQGEAVLAQYRSVADNHLMHDCRVWIVEPLERLAPSERLTRFFGELIDAGRRVEEPGAPRDTILLRRRGEAPR